MFRRRPSSEVSPPVVIQNTVTRLSQAPSGKLSNQFKNNFFAFIDLLLKLVKRHAQVLWFIGYSE